MPNILFLCPRGGAKSVIASSYFNRAAAELSLPFTATAAASEDPYEAVPAVVVDLLAREGLDVGAFRPRAVRPEDVSGAARTIRCDQWADVPLVSVDAESAAAAIRTRIDALVRELLDR